ncbi:unnamed protein product [Dibothriocephalus latus]|uniref:Uncharacterized protein n=1 Tax=Dibothriocephalus latus TaxID=60516 RepID=A0A3P7LBV7_DIBLA|nr:unnamed protein product [Dibothriocephalus latus]
MVQPGDIVCDDTPADVADYRPAQTNLVRVARIGGRQDLLCFREKEPIRELPQPPPRCQWPYLLQHHLNDLAREAAREDYTYRLPAYIEKKPIRYQKLPTKIPQTSPPPLPKKIRWIPGKLPEDRAGYTDYNKRLHKTEYSGLAFPDLKELSDQPESMAALLSQKYTSDYDEYRKQWREVKHLMQPRSTCKPIAPKRISV